MEFFGFKIERTKAITLAPLSSRGGWWTVIREPYTGAWQRNEEVTVDNVLTNSTAYACIKLISSDIAKLTLRLVELNSDGIWVEIDSPAFSPVIRKPNRYQICQDFIEQWVVSKLTWGNTYVLKQRDQRGVVVALYVLDPSRVTPLVSHDGSVYYELRRDDLSGLPKDTVTVPASEIIHDKMVTLFHPLVGVSPIYACGAPALQGLKIQTNSSKFFGNGSQPGGILTAPGAIKDETAQRLKAYWDENYTGDNVGKVAILGDGLKYEAMSVNAADSQLILQLKWTDERICSCFGVPPYMVHVGDPPPYANAEPLIQQYYNQCLQALIKKLEGNWDDGVGILQKVDGRQYGTEFDISDLIWMDVAARSKAASDGIGSGALSPDEARKDYFGKGPVSGGGSPMVQQQYYSLAALAQRDADTPFAKPSGAIPASADDDADLMDEAAAFFGGFQKAQEVSQHAGA